MGHGVYASCTDDAEETQGTHNQVRPWQVAVLLAVLFAVYRNEIFVFWGGIMVRYIVNRFIVSDNLQFIGSLIWELE